MKKKSVGRPKGLKLTQEHKDKIAATQKAKAAHWKRTGMYKRRATKRAKAKLHLRSFKLSEVKGHQVVFTIMPRERPVEIVLDFKNETITINISNMPNLTSDFGFTRENLTDFLRQLETKYPGKVMKIKKFDEKPWKKKKRSQAYDRTPQYKKLKHIEKKGREIGKNILESVKDGTWKKEMEEKEKKINNKELSNVIKRT